METVSEIIGKLAAIGPARRGQLTEQSYTVTGKDGKPRKQGPYYVLTWSDGGEKRTKRIPASEVERVREELRAGQEIDELILSYRRAKEAEADAGIQKKTTRRNAGGTALKSSRPSTRSAKAPGRKARSASPRSRRR